MTHDEMQKLIRDLSSFTRAGVPAPHGLRHLAAQMNQPRMRGMYEGLAAALERGLPLSQALAQAVPPPPPELIAAIQCGEVSGDMSAVLKFILEHSQRIKRHHSAMLTALFYPAVVAIVASLILLFFLVYLVPRFEDMYAQLGADRLPGPTELLVKLSYNGTASFVLVGIIVAIVAGLAMASRRGTAPVIMKALDLFVPLVSMSDGAILARFLGLMLVRGTPLPASLRAASLAVWLNRTRYNLLIIADEVEKGAAAGPQMALVFPPTAAYLFQQAEERGETLQVCQGIADYCEEHFELLSERMSRLIEPVIIILLGLIVGGIVISLYLPLFEIGSHIR
ncbi:MAG: type II secretion system F family protein [Candidatus Sumerlaeota bacterium]|nr:type II secretion system F family protein [Candidatus Sumerlaeota bacterium]